MKTVGVRALKQNASAVVAEVAAGEVVTVTDRGRAVAQMVPLPTGRLAGLIAAGRARPAKCSLAQLGAPPRRTAQQVSVSAMLAQMREEERY
ncbi:MAG: type II toxin-antitoxin system prevent-host-death family antitoxin [Candidatus Dormibacteria bacterium]